MPASTDKRSGRWNATFGPTAYGFANKRLGPQVVILSDWGECDQASLAVVLRVRRNGHSAGDPERKDLGHSRVWKEDQRQPQTLHPAPNINPASTMIHGSRL